MEGHAGKGQGRQNPTKHRWLLVSKDRSVCKHPAVDFALKYGSFQFVSFRLSSARRPWHAALDKKGSQATPPQHEQRSKKNSSNLNAVGAGSSSP